MAGWERYGEAEKYGRGEEGLNKNPKHIGEPLRKLTLEDRLELRKRAREWEASKNSPATQMNLDDEDDEDSTSGKPAEASNAPRNSVKGRSAGPLAKDTEKLVEDLEEGVSEIESTKGAERAVVDLDAVGANATLTNGRVKPIEVVELDDGESTKATDTAAARKARRKANAPKAKAAPTSGPVVVE